MMRSRCPQVPYQAEDRSQENDGEHGAANLGGPVPRHAPLGEGAPQGKGQRHDRIDMRPRERAEHVDQNHDQ